MLRRTIFSKSLSLAGSNPSDQMPWLALRINCCDLFSTKDAKGLKKIRNFPPDLAEHRIGKELLGIIKDVLKSDSTNWPEVRSTKPPTARVMAIVEILKLLLKLQSAEHQVASKLIASASDLEAIAKDDDADVPALNGWRREVFGEQALAMKHGKRGIGIQNDRVRIFDVERSS